MNRTVSSHGAEGHLGRLFRAIARTAGRLMPSTGSGYRPERHYMRGTGPKSRRLAPGDEGTPKAT